MVSVRVSTYLWFQPSFCGSAKVVRTGKGSIVLAEFFSYYFLYNLSAKSRMLGRVTSLMLKR